MVKRRDPDTGEYRQLTWQSLLLMGLTNAEVRGAIIVSWRIINAVALLWLAGWLSSVGFPGPVRAAEMESVKNETRDTRIEGLEARMFDLQVKKCEALKANQSQRAYTIQLQGLADKYRMLTNREPLLPTCQELD